MKQRIDIRARWKGLLDTVTRYPLTIILFVAAVITNAIAINTQSDEIFIRLFVTFILGASICAVCQMLYERFFQNPVLRFSFMGISVAFSVLYYLLIMNSHWGREVTIRTMVIFFLLFIAFLWIPVIRSRINFNQSFMALFKAFFTAIFFTGIMFLGVALIIGATNMLIFRVNERAYIHAANIIFTVFAPVYFLTLIPRYPQKEDAKEAIKERPMEPEEQSGGNIMPHVTIEYERISEEYTKREEALRRLISPARFLETLISYIIIPITAIFTLILLLYIIMNITGDFWKDNLMEPLLLSYSITVIIVYLLASNLQNAFARYFRMIFPKVLLPVVLFQTLASSLKVRETGITYGRYFVILFGIFATITAIIFCVVPACKNGMIAPILILLSLISVVPPTDAFTLSRVNQIGRLEKALKRNAMLADDNIIAKADISNQDKNIIQTSVRYLDSMEYTKKIRWLSAYNKSCDFKATFGFAASGQTKDTYRNVFVERDMSQPISIAGYDYMIFRNYNNQSNDFQTSTFEIEGNRYRLRLDNASKDKAAILLEKGKKELIRFKMNEIFGNIAASTKTSVDIKTVTFTTENASAILTVVADRISINEWSDASEQFADIYILVKVK